MLSYVLPLRSSSPRLELTSYLETLAGFAEVGEVLVVDGSAPEVTARHAEAWGPVRGLRHILLDAAGATPMGKVGGVLAGLREAAHETVVVADDDVRWTPDQLGEAARRLARCEVLRPQNWFDPQPWHARWDTGRMLLNRVSGGDWPGTLVVRRSAILDAGGYAGDVLFENLELVRTVRAAGGREHVALDILVRRLPPPTRQFLDQRVRQAYDELARPWRLAGYLALVPMMAATRGRAVAPLAVLTTAGAEVGRRRGGGREVFPTTAALWAPLWLGERAVTSWLAVASRLAIGGIRYRGTVLHRTATPMRHLRRRLEERQPLDDPSVGEGRSR